MCKTWHANKIPRGGRERELHVSRKPAAACTTSSSTTSWQQLTADQPLVASRVAAQPGSLLSQGRCSAGGHSAGCRGRRGLLPTHRTGNKGLVASLRRCSGCALVLCLESPLHPGTYKHTLVSIASARALYELLLTFRSCISPPLRLMLEAPWDVLPPYASRHCCCILGASLASAACTSAPPTPLTQLCHPPCRTSTASPGSHDSARSRSQAATCIARQPEVGGKQPASSTYASEWHTQQLRQHQGL